jgi:hypothetical protein
MEFAMFLAHARREKAEAEIALAKQEIITSRVKTAAEWGIIDRHGDGNGVKGLGSNESAQDRAMLYHLEMDEECETYRAIRGELALAKANLLRASVELEILLDQRRDFENALRVVENRKQGSRKTN